MEITIRASEKDVKELKQLYYVGDKTGDTLDEQWENKLNEMLGKAFHLGVSLSKGAE
jgi:hypothetical protein